MKRSVWKGKVYGKLIKRLFLQTLAVLGAAGGTVLVLREVFRGKLADAIIRAIAFLGSVSWQEAYRLYDRFVRGNLEYIIIFLIILFFLAFFLLSLSWFTKYFDQIVKGVDGLTEEDGEPIAMSRELEFMETKLSEVRDQLRKRAEKAREAEQRKNDLVVYLAHDIRTPLTSVIGYLSLLDEAADMPEAQRKKYIHIALEKANRLELLIDEFFEITRYNLQSVPLEKTEIDLSYMMVQVCDELYPLLVSKDQEVTIDIGEDVFIEGDPEKLARVFNNILKNAIAYSKKVSPILVSCQRETDRILISIQNEGTIPAVRLETIFEKFYRMDAARTSASGGAGLGLAIARDIVTLHGGSIQARSNDGTTVFEIALPCPPTDPQG